MTPVTHVALVVHALAQLALWTHKCISLSPPDMALGSSPVILCAKTLPTFDYSRSSRRFQSCVMAKDLLSLFHGHTAPVSVDTISHYGHPSLMPTSFMVKSGFFFKVQIFPSPNLFTQLSLSQGTITFPFSATCKVCSVLQQHFSWFL